jgi:hypothetical protein
VDEQQSNLNSLSRLCLVDEQQSRAEVSSQRSYLEDGVALEELIGRVLLVVGLEKDGGHEMRYRHDR